MDQDQLNRLTELTGALSNDTSSATAAGRFMIYGGSGAGKSHLSMQILDAIVAPDKAIVWIDSHDNYLIADQIGIKHPWQRIPFTFIEDLRLMAQAIQEGIEPWNYVGGILLDEASMMSQADIDRLHEHRVKNWNPSDHKGKEAPLSPDWDDSRPAYNRWRNMLRDFIAVPGLHIVMTAHEFVPGSESKETRIRADFPPATYKESKAKVALVGRLEEDTKIGQETTRTIQVRQTGNADGKNRLGIADVRFDARYLPQGIADWLKVGAPEAADKDEEVVVTPTPEPEQDSIMGDLPEIEEFTITPIN